MKKINRIRTLLVVFICALILSGLTAVPLVYEVKQLNEITSLSLEPSNQFRIWIKMVNHGLQDTSAHYPFLFLGTDWLAFGHLVIAAFFIGPVIDPIRNRFVVDIGFLACVMVIPTALIMGSARGVPVFWQCVDSSFGAVGALLLYQVKILVDELVLVNSSSAKCSYHQ